MAWSLCINPVNKEKVPLYVADYVLMEYGTGVVMAVPAHDERDFVFAKTYHLPTKIVIQPKDQHLDKLESAFTDSGVLVSSEQFDGMDSNEAKKAISNYLEEIQRVGLKYNTNYEIG